MNPLQLLPLARASAPIRVRVEGEVVAIPLPTIRVVAEGSASMIGAAEGATSDTVLLLEVLEGWLPERAYDLVARLPYEESGKLIMEWMEEGTSPPRELNSGAGSDNQSANGSEPDLFLTLCDVAQTFGGDAWTVYNTWTWAFFIQMLYRLDAGTARNLLRVAEVEILPHTGKAAGRTLRQMRGRARGYPFDDGTEPPADPPEVVARGRARIRELFGVHNFSRSNADGGT